MTCRCACVWTAAVACALGGSAASALAQLDVSCSTVELLPDNNGSGLGGRFMYVASTPVDPPYELVSTMLVLTREGEIIQEIPVQVGEVIQIALRDKVIIQEHEGQPYDWLIHAPGVLFRAEISKGFESGLAYCSPYAAIRVDRPEDLVFVKTTASETAAAHLTVGVAQMIPESIQIMVDCVDIVDATSAVFPGGPFSGTAEIASTMVDINEMVGDLDRGTISFTLEGLPGGTHLVMVSGTPTYIDDLPPGFPMWHRPLGALEHEREIYIFAAEITSPGDGSILPLAPTLVEGTIAHGLMIDSLRVYGADVPLPPAVFVPGDGCVGDSYQVNFSVELPVANVDQDFEMGDDVLSSLDPGVNFITALATDELDHVSNDRVRVALGDVVLPLAPPAPGRGPVAGAPHPAAGGSTAMQPLGPPDECSPMDEIPGFVKGGFAVSLSEEGLGQAIRAKVLDMISTELDAALSALEGQTIEALLDPCAAGFTTSQRMVWYGDGVYPLDVLAPILEARAGRQPNAANAGARRRATRPGATPGAGPAYALGPNSPPVWEPIDDQSVDPLALLSIPLVATDPDGDDVMFLAGTIPANAQVVEDRFEFLPACDQIGSHMVTLVASDGMDTAEESFMVTVNDLDPGLPIDPEITAVNFNPDDVTMDVMLVGEDEVQISFGSGPMEIVLHDDDCVIDCLLACCFSYNLDFEVLVDNIQATTSLTAEQLLCGIEDPGDLPEPEILLENLQVHFTDVSVGGVLAWITPAGLLVQVLDFFGVREFLLNAFASDLIEDAIRQPLADAIVNQFPGVTFSGLRELEFSTDLPPAVPLTLDAMASDVPVIIPSSAIKMGIFSSFTPQTPEDPTPPWFPTASDIPDAGTEAADVVVATSDDGLNQMMSAVVATGILRHQFTGLTVGDVAPGLSIPALGIEEDTPIVLSIDASQDEEGNAIPPIMGFTDDPMTDDLEFKVRVQVTVRGILPRGGTIVDDRDLCSCLDFSPGCQGEPCVFYETVLKLNFLTSAVLTVDPGPAATLAIIVTEIQQLEREEGFDSYEAMDFQDDEDQIVDTSATSPLLELLRQSINSAVPPFVIPTEALTLDGWVSPVNFRLFSATLDDAGLGTQDYAGILADIE